jgi:hypothetical protein
MTEDAIWCGRAALPDDNFREGSDWIELDMLPNESSSVGTGEGKALGNRPGKRLLGGANPISSRELCLNLRGDDSEKAEEKDDG